MALPNGSRNMSCGALLSHMTRGSMRCYASHVNRLARFNKCLASFISISIGCTLNHYETHEHKTQYLLQVDDGCCVYMHRPAIQCGRTLSAQPRGCEARVEECRDRRGEWQIWPQHV